jgi:ABC-type transport system substrate-binding protein
VRATPRALTFALACALGLAACPAKHPQPVRPTGASTTPTTPSGGSLTVAYPSEPPTLDPFARGGDSTATTDVMRLMCAPLAAVATIANEVIDIHPAATWSDGSHVTADDVVATWRAGRRAHLGAFSAVTAVRKLAATRARVTGTGAWATAFECLIPAAARTLARRWPVSAGPYVMRAWRPGLDISFAANARAPGGAPKIGALRIVFVPDATGALTLLRRGSVDVAAGYRTPDWQRRVAEAKARAFPGEVRSVQLALNTARAPLDKVAQALVDSIDRARVRSVVVQDPPSGGEPANLAAARGLLERSGWRGSGVRKRGGVPLSVTLAFDGADEMSGVVARAVEYQSARAGFETHAIALDAAELWGSWRFGRNFQAAILTAASPTYRRAPGATRSVELFSVREITAAREGITVAPPAAVGGPFTAAATWTR